MSNHEKIFSFLSLIEKLHDLKRVMYRSDQKSTESDSEHTWHLCLFILCFEKELPKEVDRLKLIKLALLHDIPELYAGDTFAFDKQGRQGKKEREMQAARKLFDKLPSPIKEEFLELFEEFENNNTLEARYAQSFDKLQALFMSHLSKAKALHENNISAQQLKDYSYHLMQHDQLTKDLYDDLFNKLKEDGLE